MYSIEPSELVGAGPDRIRELALGVPPERVVVKCKLMEHTHGWVKGQVQERTRDWAATDARHDGEMASRGLAARLATGRPASGVAVIENLQEVSVSQLIADLAAADYLITEVFWQAHHTDVQRFFLWICFDRREKAETYDAGQFDIEVVPESTRQFVMRFLAHMPFGYVHVHANLREYEGRAYRLDMVDCVAVHPKRKAQHVDPAKRVKHELRFTPHTYRAESL